MLPIIFIAAPQPVQTVVYTHPTPVVIYQAAPRLVFAPVYVVRGQCANGQSPK